MDQDVPLRRRDRLSTRLIVAVMGWALLIGAILAAAQMLIDARAQSRELDRSANQALEALKQPAVEAVYEIDRRLADQVLNGLSAFPGVRRAELTMQPDVVLAEHGGKHEIEWRLTDPLFGAERSYAVDLPDPRGDAKLGELRISIDTYDTGRAFLERSLLSLATSLLWAMLLGLVLLVVVHLKVTRPLEHLVDTLDRAGGRSLESLRIDEPPGHGRDELGRLAAATNRLLGAVRESYARRTEAEARASFLSQYDDLTGLPNRRLFMTRLSHAIVTAAPRGEPLAVVLIDLREFREINRLHGNSVGDEVLRQVARRLEAAAGAGAFLARLGQDVFTLLCRDSAGRSAIETLIAGLTDEFSQPLAVGTKQMLLSAWIGVALYPDDAVDAEQLIQNAESALSHAKRSGDSGVRFFEAGNDDEGATRKQLSNDLRRHDLAAQLHLVYEPQVASGSGRVVGVETLIRWRHPEYGLLRPASFIRLAEENGAIHTIGNFVLRQACAKVMAWRLALGEPLRIAVNVSATQLRRGHLDASVARLLETMALPPEALELEITETAIVENIQIATDVLHRVRELGVGISIDDFGTGHASLGYLKQLPVTKLKIDMSFVRDLLTDANDATIVRAIISLGHSLGLSVTAEGIESTAQRDMLVHLGCDSLQGMLFGCGLEEDELLARIRTRRFGDAHLDLMRTS